MVSNICVSEISKGASIWDLWNPMSWRENVFLVKRQIIHLDLTSIGGLNILLTIVYANNDERERSYGIT